MSTEAFHDEAINSIVQDFERASDTLEKNRTSTDNNESSEQQSTTVSSQDLWAINTLSHQEAEEFDFEAVIAGTERRLINPLQDTLVNDPLLNDTADDYAAALAGVPDFISLDDVPFPPFTEAFSVGTNITTNGITTDYTAPPGILLLNEVPSVMEMDPFPAQKTMIVQQPHVSLPAKIRRKRNSGLLEATAAAPLDAPIDCSTSNGKRGKKKVKLYEKPDKNDPLVQRAGYAKSYREKKKHENETLKLELEITKKELETENAKKADLEKELADYKSREEEMKETICQKDKEIISLTEALKEEQEKNALNPQQTEEILKSIHGVVKAACPRNVKTVNIQVSEPLAKKKSAALGPDKMKAICAEENLRNQPCTFTFEIDDMNKLTAHKK